MTYLNKFQKVIFMLMFIATLEFIGLCHLTTNIRKHECEVQPKQVEVPVKQEPVVEQESVTAAKPMSDFIVDAEPVVTPSPVIDVEEVYKNDIPLIAKTVWGEARGCSTMEQAAVIWCILNRVDSEGYGFGHGIEYVVTFPYQFHGYNPNNPVTDEIYELTVDVLTRWEMEKNGQSDVGRVLPKEYLYFSGNGIENTFRTEYTGGNVWNWNSTNPYTD